MTNASELNRRCLMNAAELIASLQGHRMSEWSNINGNHYWADCELCGCSVVIDNVSGEHWELNGGLAMAPCRS